jgi:hypothetical protein
MPRKAQWWDNVKGRPQNEGVELQVGDRFQLSLLGAERCPRMAGRIGTVAALILNSGTITVRFDGNKRSTRIHRDYIEPMKLARVPAD